MLECLRQEILLSGSYCEFVAVFFFRFNMIFKRTNFLNVICNHRTPAISSKGVSRGAQPLVSLEGCANHFRITSFLAFANPSPFGLGIFMRFLGRAKTSSTALLTRDSHPNPAPPICPLHGDSVWTNWRHFGNSSGDFFDFSMVFWGKLVLFLLNSPGCPLTTSS